MTTNARTAGPVTLAELDAPPPISPLVADLMEASLTATHATTNAVIDGLTERAEKAEATNDAIRHQVSRLLAGDFMPTSEAILRALWPSAELVAQFRRDGEAL